jgi:lysyl-tRNA synthetase class 2
MSWFDPPQMMTRQITLMEKRSDLERSIREFFWNLGYREVRTPMIVHSPGMEPHIRPFEIQGPKGTPPRFLPTSPEFGMKKLLAKGMPRIFQICSSFRNEPRSPEHHPEFTMLEFYETNLSLEGLQDRVETLFCNLALRTHQSLRFESAGRTLSLEGPWRRFRVVDLFLHHLGVNLRELTEARTLAELCRRHGLAAEDHEPWDDLYFKLWLNLIEPKLPEHEAFFVTHYPLSQSSLCNPVLDETGFAWANRFEVYVGRTELGNAFDELRDPAKQRLNFEKDQKIRRGTYGSDWPESPIDEELLSAIERMPPTSGIAIGLDRLFMILFGARTIDEVLYLPSHA